MVTIRFKAAVDAPATGNSYVLDGRVHDLKGAPKLEGDLSAKLALPQAHPHPPSNRWFPGPPPAA